MKPAIIADRLEKLAAEFFEQGESALADRARWLAKEVLTPLSEGEKMDHQLLFSAGRLYESRRLWETLVTEAVDIIKKGKSHEHEKEGA